MYPKECGWRILYFIHHEQAYIFPTVWKPYSTEILFQSVRIAKPRGTFIIFMRRGYNMVVVKNACIYDQLFLISLTSRPANFFFFDFIHAAFAYTLRFLLAKWKQTKEYRGGKEKEKKSTKHYTLVEVKKIITFFFFIFYIYFIEPFFISSLCLIFHIFFFLRLFKSQ